jgi:hypothetical protein
MLPEAGIDATVDLDESVTEMEGAKSVRVTVSDGAMPPNLAGYTFGFVYDKTPATYSISSTQGNLSPGDASSVQLSVDGTVTDKYSNLEVAELRLLLAPAGECFGGTLAELEALEALEGHGDDASEAEKMRDANIIPGDRLGGTGKNKHKRELADGSAKSASLSSTFTLSPADPSGPEMYCFRLDVEDVARTAGAKASSEGNTDDFVVGPVFNVHWPDNRPDPPVTYGFVFTDASDAALTMVAVNEGDSTTYKVALDQMPTADVTVELGVKEADRAVYAQLTPASLTFTSANYMTAQTVKVKTVPHDGNTDSEMFTLTHDPSGAEYEAAATAELSGTVKDDEIALSLSGVPADFSENGDNVMVTLTASTMVADTFTSPKTSELSVGDDYRPLESA